MKNSVKIGGAALVASALMLTACGGGGTSGGPATSAAASAGADISKLMNVNEQPRDNIKDGGKVTLPIGNLGPDFNVNSQNGSSADVSDIQNVFNIPFNGGCWKYDYAGKAELNTNFCESFDSKVDNGKQTITIKINPKAKYNDDSPIDYKSFQNSFKQLSGQVAENNIVSPGAYERIESVDKGDNDKTVVVKMKELTYPLSSLFGVILNPNINTPEIFNNGFVENLHPEWAAGPFKVQTYDKAAKTLSFVPNDKWWGDKPKLDQVVFRELESSATIPAFKNGEIDATSASTANRYKQLEGTPNSELRRGQRLFAGGLNINAKADGMTDVAVRKAATAALDRKKIDDVRYQGLNWTEELPGSQMLMPFSQYYQNNWPFDSYGPDAAAKIMTAAGYAKGSDGFWAKDGKKVSFKLSNFGDDPTVLALVQTIQKQMQDAGFDVGIDQHGSSEFGTVIGKRQFQISISGYTMGADATDAVKQYYYSKTSVNGLGDADLDARIDKLPTIADDKERNKEAMDIEKAHWDKYFDRGILFNGPSILAVKKGLANWGVGLFHSQNSPEWENVGWQK